MTTWIVCGVLQLEFESFLERKLVKGTAVYPDSMLHMRPEKIEETLEKIFSQPAFKKPCVIVYGDCCSKMIDLQRQNGVARIAAVNCVQMLVDHATYRDFMKKEAFVFLPEWAVKWKSVFIEELGLTEPVLAREFFKDTRREIIYLDTGLLQAPTSEMNLCSDFTGLQWSIKKIDLEFFLKLLLDAENRAVNSLNA